MMLERLLGKMRVEINWWNRVVPICLVLMREQCFSQDPYWAVPFDQLVGSLETATMVSLFRVFAVHTGVRIDLLPLRDIH